MSNLKHYRERRSQDRRSRLHIMGGASISAHKQPQRLLRLLCGRRVTRRLSLESKSLVIGSGDEASRFGRAMKGSMPEST